MCSNTVHEQRCVGRSTNMDLETQGAYSSLQSTPMFNTHRADVPQNAQSSQIARGKVYTMWMSECLVIRDLWQIPIAPRRFSGTTEMQCVAVCCGVLRCIAVCCRVLRCIAVCSGVLQCVTGCLWVCDEGAGTWRVPIYPRRLLWQHLSPQPHALNPQP